MLTSDMKAWLIALLALTQMGAATLPAPSEPSPDDRVPLVAIIANPSLYDGRHVETSGYLNLELEGDALYVGKDDFDAFQTQNGVWFSVPRMDRSARRSLARHYVHASGTFHADPKGAYGAYRGTLSVEGVEIAATRRQLSFLYEQSLSPIPLPWPPVIGLLVGLTAFVYGGHIIRRALTRRDGEGPRLSAHAFRGQSRAWLLLVCLVSLFMALRLIGSAQIVSMPRVFGLFDIWFAFSVVECVVGACGLAAMWAAHATRRRTLCVIAIVLQLIAPGARELMRMDTWQSQMTYPFVPHAKVYTWLRHP
ncbi:hypothetical protein ASD38_09880 [Caulobacter sp. Root487D2Y]|nr:hypothetical protein ASD38_09880 [Caulobacter sp. Root487D2Y]